MDSCTYLKKVGQGPRVGISKISKLENLPMWNSIKPRKFTYFILFLSKLNRSSGNISTYPIARHEGLRENIMILFHGGSRLPLTNNDV